MFHRDFQVVGHARRQRSGRWVSLQYALVLGGEALERVGGISTQRRNCHQPRQ